MTVEAGCFVTEDERNAMRVCLLQQRLSCLSCSHRLMTQFPPSRRGRNCKHAAAQSIGERVRDLRVLQHVARTGCPHVGVVMRKLARLHHI